MLLRLAALAMANAILVPAMLHSQVNNFDLKSDGRNVGHTTFALAKVKQGYKLTSRLSYQLDGIESDASNEFKFSEAYAYIEGGSSSINTQMHTSYVPNKNRTDLVIGMVQGGAQESRHLAIKPDLAILPPFDAGAAQAMLLLATTHPSANNLYNVVVPGGAPTHNAGRGKGEPPTDPEAGRGHQASGNNAFDARWTKGPDTNGTLDGKPIGIHTYILKSGKYVWVFFADDQNTLMQLDNSMAHSSYIRVNFKLAAPNAVPR